MTKTKTNTKVKTKTPAKSSPKTKTPKSSPYLYKLTDENMRTRAGYSNAVTWELNKTVRATEPGNELCSPQVIHAYSSPLVAVLLNPQHANFKFPRLFRATGIVVANDLTKVGTKALTLVKELKLPVFSRDELICFAILCAKHSLKNNPDVTDKPWYSTWNTWADNWLNGTDRSKTAAWEVWTWAAAAAAEAAAAEAAAAAAEAASKLNLHELALKAKREMRKENS